MKKILLLIALLPLLFSCKTPAKLADSSHTTIKDKTQLNIEEKHETKEQTTTVSMLESVEQSTVIEETKLIEYDTDKPIDLNTGKPPVKSEQETKKTTTTGKQVKEQAQATTDTAEKIGNSDKSKINLEANTTTEHEEAPQKPKIAYYYYIILIMLVVGVGYWLNKKFKFIGKIL